jgi:hypothetical protein
VRGLEILNIDSELIDKPLPLFAVSAPALKNLLFLRAADQQSCFAWQKGKKVIGNLISFEQNLVAWQ